MVARPRKQTMTNSQTKISRKATTRRKSGRVRIEDVAKLAGVGTMTVSRAINNPNSVSQEKRTAIEAAIKKTGYVPNLMAGSLAANKSKIIAVLTPLMKTSVFADLVQGMSDILDNEGYQILIGSTSYSPEREEQLVRAFLGRRVDGLVMAGVIHTQETMDLLKSANITVVETLDLADQPIDMTVGCSMFDAASDVARYLTDLGYSKIGLITPPKDLAARVKRRTDGFLAGLRKAKAPLDPDRQVETIDLSINAGAKALERLLAKMPDTDAVFCTADMLAIGALLACHRNKWKVPERIAIVGFGDIEIAADLTPSLTTIRLKGYEMGQTTAKLLLNKLHNDEIDDPRCDIGYELIRRESA